MGWCSFWRDCIVPSIFGSVYQTKYQLLVGGPWDFFDSQRCCGDFWSRQFLGTFSEADSLAYGCEIYDGSLNTAVIHLPYPTNYTPNISSEGTWIRKVKIMAKPRPFQVPQLSFRSTAKFLTFQVPAVWTVPCHGPWTTHCDSRGFCCGTWSHVPREMIYSSL